MWLIVSLVELKPTVRSHLISMIDQRTGPQTFATGCITVAHVGQAYGTIIRAKEANYSPYAWPTCGNHAHVSHNVVNVNHLLNPVELKPTTNPHLISMIGQRTGPDKRV